ncbi:MAG: ribbon-helix-helix domain-containing protein [Cyanobacteria bacterium J06638_22]
MTTGETQKAKRPIKQQTVYLPLDVYEQLRRLAFEERVKMHSLLMEGLDRVFRDRGLQSLEDIKRNDAP